MAPRADYSQKVRDVDKSPSPKIPNESQEFTTKTTPWRSIYVAALCSFAQSLQYGLFFSSLWPYLKRLDPTVTETFFGYVVAIYSLGQCVASPAFGYWSNRVKQVRTPTIFGLNMMLLGNIIYLAIDVLPSGHRYGMATSRVLIGIGSSMGVLLRAYASTASVSADRSRAIGCVAAGVAIGLVIGPGLQALFSPLGEIGLPVLPGWSLNMYKAPALLAAIVNISGILLMYFAFDEQYAGLKDGQEAKELPKADVIAVAVCIVTRFTQLSVMSNIETLGSAYSMLMFDLSAPEAVRVNATSQAVQGIAAAVILLPFLFSDIGKRLKQRTVNIACVLSFLAFHFITYPWGFGKTYITVNDEGTVHAACASPQKTIFGKFDNTSATAQHQRFANDVCYNQARIEAISQSMSFTTQLVGVSGNTKTLFESEAGGCDASRFAWCTTTPRVNMWLYYVSLSVVFETTFAFGNVVLPTLFSKIIGPRRQVVRNICIICSTAVVSSIYVHSVPPGMTPLNIRPDEKARGTMQGVFQMSGSIARMIEPLILNIVYAYMGPRGVWQLQIGQLGLTLSLWLLFMRRMVPLEKQPASGKILEKKPSSLA